MERSSVWKRPWISFWPPALTQGDPRDCSQKARKIMSKLLRDEKKNTLTSSSRRFLTRGLGFGRAGTLFVFVPWPGEVGGLLGPGDEKGEEDRAIEGWRGLLSSGEAGAAAGGGGAAAGAAAGGGAAAVAGRGLEAGGVGGAAGMEGVSSTSSREHQ